jgi:hypothetical protein
MTKLTDPALHLRNLVAKEGRSDTEGVVMREVSVVATQEDYGYAIDYQDVRDRVHQDLEFDRAIWDPVLVNLRRKSHSEVVIGLGTIPEMRQFMIDGIDLSMIITLPEINVSDFEDVVVHSQVLIKTVAEFAGLVPTTVRFNIGHATLDWDDVVAQGYAHEVEVGF